jgi:hypothetical protein
LATSFGVFAPSRGSVAPLDFLVADKVIFNETAAIIVALLAAGTFLFKAAFSIFLPQDGTVCCVA